MGKIYILPTQEKYLLINKPYLINILQKKRKKQCFLYHDHGMAVLPSKPQEVTAQHARQLDREEKRGQSL